MGLWRRLRNLAGDDRHSREIAEELALHIELRTEENLARGMSAEEARQDAQRAFGNATALRERTREFDVPRWLDQFTQDFRYAVRGLRSSRRTTAVLVLSLALGIGANTAMFTLINALLLRTLPVRNPGELYSVSLGNFCSWGWIEREGNLSYAVWSEFAKTQSVFSDLFVYATETLDISNGGEVRLISGAFTSSEMWQTLGVQPVIGRTFTAAEEGATADSSVGVIGHVFWEKEFQRSESVLGRTMVIGGKPITIIGVAPASFYGLYVGDRVDVYLPLGAAALLHSRAENPITNPTAWWLTPVGRLRPGVSAKAAAAQLAALSPAVMRATMPGDWPKEAPDYLRQYFDIAPASLGFSNARDTLWEPLLILTVLVAVLLVLACANIANLQLSRALNRRREFAIRNALGASRMRIARQVLLESVLASSLGAAMGFLLAPAATRLLMAAYSTERNSLKLDLQPDGLILAFSAGLAIVTALLFGLVPALHASSVMPGDSLRPVLSSPGSGAGRVRRVLLGVQVGLAVVLTTGAILFSGTLATLMTLDAGFHTENVLLMQVETSRAGLTQYDRAAFYRRLLERCKTVPGVQSVSASYVTPINGSSWQLDISVETEDGLRPGHAYFNFVTPGFFETFSTPVTQGRSLNEADDGRAPRVALVNQEFVDRVLGGGSALGRHINLDRSGQKGPRVEVVGLVRNARYRNLRQPVPPTVYVPLAQEPNPPSELNLALRTRGPITDVIPALRHTMNEVNPKVGYLFHSFAAQVADSVVNERAIATVSLLFAGVALLLAAAGIYGIVSYSVVQRKPEIGIRMALGATPATVLRMLFAETAKIVCLGMAGGLLVAAWAAGFTRSLLYGLQPGDAWVYLCSSLVLALVAAVATAGPALRATRLDPMETLRAE